MKINGVIRLAIIVFLEFLISGTVVNGQTTKNNLENWTDMPPVVSPVMGKAVPSDATILFSKNNLQGWEGLRKKEDAFPWKIKGDNFTVEPGTGNIATKESFGDCQLHVEWKIPVNEVHENLRYGNSGVLLMGHYEVQIYSSFKNQHKIYYNGQAGSIYKQFPPLVNASLPEEEWQTFDIVFIAPTFNPDSSLRSPARLTVFHNGVLIQYHVALKGRTNNTDFTEYKWHPEKLPLVLQEHISRISFRNIWIRRLNMVQ